MSTVYTDKNKVEISQNFVAFSEYMNFTHNILKPNLNHFWWLFWVKRALPWKKIGQTFKILGPKRDFFFWMHFNSLALYQVFVLKVFQYLNQSNRSFTNKWVFFKQFVSNIHHLFLFLGRYRNRLRWSPRYGRWGRTANVYKRKLFLVDKVQLILKYLFDFFNSPKKRTKNSTSLLWYIKSNCVHSFFGRMEDTKKTFRN